MPDSLKISVALCTRNPRPAFINETLNALRGQTAPTSSWELLVIDNGSSPALTLDLSWHPNARLVVESRPGIAFARSSAARLATAAFILFVDDDNALAPDYLEQAGRLIQENPRLGCFGGQLLPRFEKQPDDWTRAYWDYLAIKPLSEARTASGLFDYPALPPTAGMVVRKDILDTYTAAFAKDPIRQKYLHSRCEDLDIGMHALRLGYQVGRFPAMRLEHLMPAARLEEDNLLRLLGDSVFSTQILEACHGRFASHPEGAFARFIHRLRCWRLPRRERRFALTEASRRRAGYRVAQAMKSQSSSQPC